MSGQQTPDRFGGVREEEGLILTDEGVDPSTEGEVRNNGGTLKAKDSEGVFNLRSSGSIFGSEADDAESLGESQTSTEFPSYAQKLRLSTSSLPEGRYRIGWSFEWLGDAIADYFYTRIQLDDSTDLMNMKAEPKDTDNWHPIGGFAYVDLSSGTHTIDLDYACERSVAPMGIRKARLEIWRVS